MWKKSVNFSVVLRKGRKREAPILEKERERRTAVARRTRGKGVALQSRQKIGGASMGEISQQQREGKLISLFRGGQKEQGELASGGERDKSTWKSSRKKKREEPQMSKS